MALRAQKVSGSFEKRAPNPDGHYEFFVTWICNSCKINIEIWAIIFIIAVGCVKKIEMLALYEGKSRNKGFLKQKH